MDQEFIGILKTIYNEQGKNIFLNASKCKALLADYSKGDFKKECRFLLQAIEAKIPKEIETVQDTDINRKKSIMILFDDYGIQEEIASDITDALLYILKDVPIPIRENIKKSDNAESITKQKNSNEINHIEQVSTSITVGNILQFGDYKWQILDINEGKALLISNDIIEERSYNNEQKDITWETCALRKYLNVVFIKKFTNELQIKILETKIENTDNLWYYSKGGNKTSDKIFLLNLEEADKYFGNESDYYMSRRKDVLDKSVNSGNYFSNNHNNARAAKYENNCCWWWLRSPGIDNKSAAIVRFDGRVGVDGNQVNKSNGVRPAMWILI